MPNSTRHRHRRGWVDGKQPGEAARTTAPTKWSKRRHRIQVYTHIRRGTDNFGICRKCSRVNTFGARQMRMQTQSQTANRCQQIETGSRVGPVKRAPSPRHTNAPEQRAGPSSAHKFATNFKADRQKCAKIPVHRIRSERTHLGTCTLHIHP